MKDGSREGEDGGMELTGGRGRGNKVAVLFAAASSTGRRGMIYWSKLPPPPTSITLTNAPAPIGIAAGSASFVLDKAREKAGSPTDEEY